ncbi:MULTISPECIES: flagellar biosynthesis anti-sigma factor FlgM [unclassified Sulfurospirillum]|uniref:flagellar biosynthesis anti-sigma factor FlgM n=1 Tax=unclassified Sulfurospirillum TaxID=2618290 RepID=UPI000507C096|nr:MULTISPECIES: flagellar biosynthesis anti-sigma factor FlgM [unclassified Sulfurospirillum]KFL35354.1 flagellar biosynthesis anti-sigma factor FlgM [Sulfurospirillum sp. SCADC]
MISTVQSSNVVYVQQNSLKEDASKGVLKTEKSEGVDKVSALKAGIENGTYTFDLAKTAQAVAEELL